MTDIDLIKKYLKEDKWNDAIQKLENNYPVQYIIGNVEFYNSIIKVNESVLIPRFETEYLVEKTIKLIKKLKINNPKILEIGTGSGCISIALQKELNSVIDALDISEEALFLAKENAQENNVKINFIHEDIHNFDSNIIYDVIISNPPYVPINSEVDIKTKYEPQNAIFAEDNGLYFYKIILQKIKNNLSNNYLIAFEIGDKEGKAIINLINKYLPNAYILLENDYNNYERYIFITNNRKLFSSN